MNTAAAKPLCLVTGARGYLGGRVHRGLSRAQVGNVRALTREPRPALMTSDSRSAKLCQPRCPPPKRWSIAPTTSTASAGAIRSGST